MIADTLRPSDVDEAGRPSLRCWWRLVKTAAGWLPKGRKRLTSFQAGQVRPLVDRIRLDRTEYK